MSEIQPATEAGPSNALVSRPAAAAVDASRHPSGIVPTLQNVVATVNLGCRLDLKQIALHARNAEYNPKRFAAVIMRIRDPKTTALIFASGKMVCTGAKSESDSRLAAKKYARIIQRLGFAEAEFKEFKIQNIVGSCDVKFPIRLEGLLYAHVYFATYEPELFPGLIYRMKQPKIVLLIFVSGKVVLTGAKKREEIYQAFENIYPTLSEFRKKETQSNLLGAAPSPAPAAAAAPAAAGPSAAAAGATMGPPRAAGAMLPPPAPPSRSGAMLPPASRGAMLPPPSPAMHQGGGAQVPPATPHFGPPSTPSYAPPATPSYVPPATPAYQAPANPSYQVPAVPPGPKAPVLPPGPK